MLEGVLERKIAEGQFDVAQTISNEIQSLDKKYHTMLLFYIPKLIIQTGIDCWVGYILNLYAKALNFVLSDDTMIKSAAWKELKLYAMSGNYAEMNWYK